MSCRLAERRHLLQHDIKLLEELTQGFDWGQYLDKKQTKAAPVSAFVHQRLGSEWGDIKPGYIIELPNGDKNEEKFCWIATIQKVAGYKALVRYVGDETGKGDFWCNLASGEIHAAGWSAIRKESLKPPNWLKDSRSDWKEFVTKQICGQPTVFSNFFKNVKNSMIYPIKKGQRLEVLDKNCLRRNRIAVIIENISGHLCVRYEDGAPDLDTFWSHAKSRNVHPIGWSEERKIELQVLSRIIHSYKSLDNFENVETENLYKSPVFQKFDEQFEVGMKLEAVDPLNLSNITVVTVEQVMSDNYLMFSVDGHHDDDSSFFYYHRTSSSIMPATFCEVNGIELTPPEGYESPFIWQDYLLKTKSKAAPPSLFPKNYENNLFEVGAKLEAVDLMDPKLICVGTVAKKVGRLIRIHFDGWKTSFDQWVDYETPNIFPVGWCELVGHQLQPPLVPQRSGVGAVGRKQGKKRVCH